MLRSNSSKLERCWDFVPSSSQLVQYHAAYTPFLAFHAIPNRPKDVPQIGFDSPETLLVLAAASQIP